MKIGVMTFHWAANYGAALQSYALVKQLQDMGHDAEDIDYLPVRTMRRLRFFDLYLRRFENIQRSTKLRSFRKKHLTLSSKKYHSSRDLRISLLPYDAVIAGSDQIWNESFLMTSEKTPNTSYYLDFVPKDVLRLSYAASFGINTITDNLREFAVPELRKFDIVSVREENAVELLAREGIEAEIVCDPTLLLEPQAYEQIYGGVTSTPVRLFNFMLRKGRESSDRTQAYVKDVLFKDASNIGRGIVTVERWLYLLKNCEFVVTDSFHCTVFAILFHKPFIAVNDKNCSMNARIRTLAQKLGLSHRVIEEYDEQKINQLVNNREIDWDAVDAARRQWAFSSREKLATWLTK